MSDERIKELEGQLSYFEGLARKTEEARLVLLGYLHAIDELTSGEIRSDATVPDMVDSLKSISAKVHAAHDRVWKK